MNSADPNPRRYCFIAVSRLLWPDKDRDVPGFPVKFVGVDKLHAAFLMKAAHAAVAWCLVQEIRVCGFPWEKTTKRPVASVYTNCETAVAFSVNSAQLGSAKCAVATLRRNRRVRFAGASWPGFCGSRWRRQYRQRLQKWRSKGRNARDSVSRAGRGSRQEPRQG